MVSCFLVYVDQHVSYSILLNVVYLGGLHKEAGRHAHLARVWRLFINMYRAMLSNLLFVPFRYMFICLKFDRHPHIT